MPFLDTNSHVTTKPYNFDIKYQSNSESYDWHGFLGTKFRGGQNYLLTVGSFFNKREYSEADWLVPLINPFPKSLFFIRMNFTTQQLKCSTNLLKHLCSINSSNIRLKPRCITKYLHSIVKNEDPGSKANFSNRPKTWKILKQLYRQNILNYVISGGNFTRSKFNLDILILCHNYSNFEWIVFYWG